MSKGTEETSEETSLKRADRRGTEDKTGPDHLASSMSGKMKEGLAQGPIHALGGSRDRSVEKGGQRTFMPRFRLGHQPEGPWVGPGEKDKY